MKFVSQIIDMFFDACRRPAPMTQLLPSNETIQGECTSRETIFSNQVIAAGTSKNSSQGSLYKGKISSSLECWLKHGSCLQVLSLSLSLSMHEVLLCSSLILHLFFLILYFFNLSSFRYFYYYPKVHVNVFLPLFH